jgi:hypothetical protein
MFPFPQVWKQQNVHRGELKSVDAVLLPDRLRMLTFGIRARYMPYPSEQKTGKGSRDDSKVPDNLQVYMYVWTPCMHQETQGLFLSKWEKCLILG